MRFLLICSAALLAVVMLVVACNTVDPGDCYRNTSGGFGGAGAIPIGAGVGVGSGDFASPRIGPLGYGAPANPCVTPSGDTARPEAPTGAPIGGTSAAAGGAGGAGVVGPLCGMGGAPGAGADAGAGGGDYTCGGGAYYTLLQGYTDDAEPTGGTACTTPTDCVNKCVAKSKYCWAEHAVHPYKPPMLGDLYQCIDNFPPASLGGSYTCLYRYPNGDACIFSYAAKFGPIHPPAPPPLCVYKSP